MKNLYLFILLFVSIGMYAQNNFYSGLEEFYSTHQKPEGTGEEIESSEYNEMLRIEQIWAPRLFAHGGDESAAATAMINYAENYSPSMSPLNPVWEELGPNKKINNNNGVGRIKRICFDPQYDGVTNKTLYATSSFGGLWRTENDGGFWIPLTDYLPFTSDADVAVSYQNSNHIFLATGYADGRFEYNNAFNHVNALHTFGVYRSTDYGITWESISDGFIEEFLEGGTTRRIIINPENENQLFCATTRGVFRCNNAMSTNPIWQKVLSNSDPALDDFRGLAFMPGNNNIVYASGPDIYKSNDGGLSFVPISINTLPADYEIHQINIATTAADADKVYAYVVGKVPSEPHNRLFIYVYHNLTGEWDYIFEYMDSSSQGYYSPSKGRMALAVSPVNSNEFYFGYTSIQGTPDYTTSTVKPQSIYGGTPCHADIHSLAFQPNVDIPDLFAGTDGGVSRKDLPNNNTYGWSSLYTGLGVNTVWGFDDSDYDYKKIIIGNQDCGTNKIIDFENKDWKRVLGGDGYGVRFDGSSLSRWFYMPSNVIFPIRYDYTSNSSPSESSFIPHVCPSNEINEHATGKLPFFNHPRTNIMYFGFEEVFRRLKPEPENGDTWDDIWIEESDVYKTNIDAWARQIQQITMSESNPDNIYVITVGVQNDPFDMWKLPTRILRTTTGGINGNCSNVAFTEITYPGFNPDPQTFFPIVSSLTIDPENENRFWITYTGFVPEYKVYRTDDGGAIWVNEDPNGTLANLPVNDIIYQHGSNDRIFIGTDAGVYIKDGSNADWEKFGDIPSVRISRLKINYCANILRAGTFGRGLWETDIPELSGYTDKTIAENTTWETNWSLKGDLVIEPGFKLTIKKQVNMPPNSKIIVKPGAKLVIDGGYITNGCEKTWQGIEVWGNSTSGLIADQGLLVLKNGAVIENAQTAMINYKPSIVPYNSSYGGIVVAKDAVFKNNDRAILLVNYPFVTSSSFENCIFEYAEGFVPYAQVSELVKLQSMNGVLFEGCSLVDNRLNVADEDKITGIESYHSSFRVLPLCTQNVLPPCPAVYQQPSRFTNLHYGIHASNFTPGLIVKVDSALFVNNINGCYLSATAYASVTRCGFTTRNNATGGYGLYLDESEDYTIEENRFDQGVDNNNSVGLIINHNGKLGDNIVYRNSFYDHRYPVLAQNDNRSPADHGLQFKCNVFDPTCKFNIMVTSDGPLNSANTGIAAKQGANLAQPDAPAGNIFSWTGPSGTATDIYNETNSVTYFYHIAQASERLQPLYFTSGKVLPEAVEGAEWIPEESCPPLISGGGGTGDTEGMKSAMATSSQKADSIQSIINILKDGGSTEDMKWEVDLSTPPETYTVYNELMNTSPYISDTIMEAAIGKEEVLPNVMIRDVMVANPHNAKNELLMDKINQRSDPMPDYMKAQIVQGRSLVSVFEELQSQLAFYRQQRKQAFSSLVKHYRSDTINAASSADSLKVLLENENSPGAKYQLAFLHLEQEAGGLGQSILSAIPSEFNLTTDELELHQLISSYYNLLVDLGQEDKRITDVDSLQIEALFEMEALQAGAPSVYARNILLALGEINYTEPILLPDFTKSSTIQQEYEELRQALDEHHYLSVFPNPAGDYLIIEHKLETKPENAFVKIRNTKGKIIKHIQVTGKQNQQTLDIKDLKPGVYIATIYVNNKELESVKFTKVK